MNIWNHHNESDRDVVLTYKLGQNIYKVRVCPRSFSHLNNGKYEYMELREASTLDITLIAEIHTKSWKSTYNSALTKTVVAKIRSDIPILLLTGYGNLTAKEDIHLWGISDLLIKPFKVKLLKDVVRKALDK